MKEEALLNVLWHGSNLHLSIKINTQRKIYYASTIQKLVAHY